MGDRPLVLVVEDDREMNALQRELLEVCGFDAVAAYTGTEAVEVHRRYRPDAVVMDVMLPEMDGLEAGQRVRHGQSSDVPIVFVSALDTKDVRRRGEQLGHSAYFTKPFDPDELVRALRGLIKDGRR